MSVKTTITRDGDKFTAVTEAITTETGFHVPQKINARSLDNLLIAAKSYKRTLDEIAAAAFFMDAALSQFHESETSLCYMETKGVAAIFGLLNDSIDTTINGCFVEGRIIEEL